MNSDKTIIIKASYKGVFKKLPLRVEDISYEEFLVMMQKVFKDLLSVTETITVKYQDDDKDWITISDTSDLEFAFSSNDYLVIKLEEPNSGVIEKNVADEINKNLKNLQAVIASVTDSLSRIGISNKKEASETPSYVKSSSPNILQHNQIPSLERTPPAQREQGSTQYSHQLSNSNQHSHVAPPTGQQSHIPSSSNQQPPSQLTHQLASVNHPPSIGLHQQSHPMDRSQSTSSAYPPHVYPPQQPSQPIRPSGIPNLPPSAPLPNVRPNFSASGPPPIPGSLMHSRPDAPPTQISTMDHSHNQPKPDHINSSFESTDVFASNQQYNHPPQGRPNYQPQSFNQPPPNQQPQYPPLNPNAPKNFPSMPPRPGLPLQQPPAQYDSRFNQPPQQSQPPQYDPRFNQPPQQDRYR